MAVYEHMPVTGLGIMSCNECCVMSVVMNAAMNVAFTPVCLKCIGNYNRLEMKRYEEKK